MDAMIWTLPFNPQTAGDFAAELQFSGNFPDTIVCLTGMSFEAPIIGVNPTQIDVDLLGCTDSVTIPITVTNTGGSDLIFEFSTTGTANSSAILDSVRTNLNASFSEITDLIPNFFEFFDGEIGASISDGGGDMYDGGNFLSINNGNALQYSNDLVLADATLGTDGQYFTRKYPGLFVFAADINNVSSFNITGDLGADGAGSVDGFQLNQNINGINYTGFAKRVYDAFDPSVNHLIIIRSTTGVTQSIPTTTSLDIHDINGLNNADRIYYLLFSEADGADIPEMVFEDVMTRFIEIVEPVSFFNSPTGEQIVAAGGSQTFDFVFSINDLNSGTYLQNIAINSNDPLNPLVEIPATVNVFGEPSIAFSQPCLNFPEISEFTSQTLTVDVTNTGCDDLEITSITSAMPEFLVNTSSATILPDETITLSVTFAPESVGNFATALTFVSNAPIDSICLTGSSFAAPIIEIDPNTIEIDLQSCSDSITVPITLTNTGGSDLNFQFTGSSNQFDGNPLDSVRTRLNSDFAEITNLLPNIFLFFDGETGNNISDGGGDMYDGGNFLSFNNGSNLNYSNDVIVSNAQLGIGGQYFTRKYPGLFVLAADINGVSHFGIDGNLGADGSGNVTSTVLTQTIAGTSYRGFVKNVSGAGDPSINHLIIVKEPTNAIQTVPITTIDDLHDINGLEQNDRIYYLLFAEAGGIAYSNSQILEVMTQFLEIVETSNFVDLPVGDFTLTPNESTTLDLNFSTQNTEGGIYEQIILVESNDPFNSPLEILVTINVSDDVCANFSFERPIDCGGQVNFTSSVVNNPTDFLWNFGDGNTSTEANPTHIYSVPGNYQVELTISNNSSTDMVSQLVEVDATFAPIETCNVDGDNNFPFMEITSFMLNEIDNESGFNSLDYTDFTCDFSTNLIIGIAYDLEIQSESFSTQDAKVWIDLDNSGSFTSDEELFFSDNGTTPHTGTITIPSTAVTGIPLRCRVGVDDDFFTLSPCIPSNSGEFEDYTVIIESNMLPPNANFSLDIIDECQGAVQFMDASTNLPTSWAWNFGDGNTSAAQNPIHIYGEAGVYTVTLVSSNGFGSDTFMFDITVNSLNPIIETDGFLIINSPINFDANVVGGISWMWDFGEGTYTVSLTVTNGLGCTSIVILEITIMLTNTNELERFLALYPNPTSGEFLIDNQSGLSYQKVQVYNAIGQLVWERNYSAQTIGEQQIDPGQLPSGTYFVKIDFTEGEVLVKELVVK